MEDLFDRMELNPTHAQLELARVDKAVKAEALSKGAGTGVLH